MNCATFITILLLRLASIKAQNVNLQCNFFTESLVYHCSLSGITIPDNENANVVIGGVHQPGQSNFGVTTVVIMNSNTPFIIPQVFTTFPFMSRLIIDDGGLIRIQPNAFAMAQHLWYLEIVRNPGLREIPANAFSGAFNLGVLDLLNNGIERIHESAFNGVNLIEALFIDNNRLREIPTNAFTPLKLLQGIALGGNQLTRIESGLFSSNSQIFYLDVNNNFINAIERTFFDVLPNLRFLNLLENSCINDFWSIDVINDWQVACDALSSCFLNFDQDSGGEVRNFILQLRGNLKISYENGTTIIRL